MTTTDDDYDEGHEVRNGYDECRAPQRHFDERADDVLRNDDNDDDDQIRRLDDMTMITTTLTTSSAATTEVTTIDELRYDDLDDCNDCDDDDDEAIHASAECFSDARETTTAAGDGT